MPPCDALHLAGYLFDIGPTSGDGPISHGDIASWMANTGIKLNPWQALTIRRLSVDYLNESYRATKRGAAAPWQSGISHEKPVNDTKNALRNLAKL